MCHWEIKELKVYDFSEEKRQEKDWFTRNRCSLIFKVKDLALLNESWVHNYRRRKGKCSKNAFTSHLKNGIIFLTAYCKSQRLKFKTFPFEYFIPTKTFWKSNFFWKETKTKTKMAVSGPAKTLTLMCASTIVHNHSLTSCRCSLPLTEMAEDILQSLKTDLDTFAHLCIFRKVENILYPWNKVQKIPSQQPKWDNCSSSIPLHIAIILYCFVQLRVRNS